MSCAQRWRRKEIEMTQAENHVILLQGARSSAEFGRALRTATSEATAEEYGPGGTLEALEYPDGSRLLVCPASYSADLDPQRGSA